jgi:hypothetical protein
MRAHKVGWGAYRVAFAPAPAHLSFLSSLILSPQPLFSPFLTHPFPAMILSWDS